MLTNLLSKYIATLPGFSILAVIMFFCSLEIQKGEKKINSKTKLLDKRFWYTPTDVKSFFKDLSKDEINIYVWIHTIPDLIFPIAYSTFLAALIIYFYGAEANWQLIIPILAAIFDWGENFTTVYLAKSYPNILSFVAWLACGCTLTKWIMIVFSGIVIFVGGLKQLI